MAYIPLEPVDIADRLVQMRDHYELAIWYSARMLPLESASEQRSAEVLLEQVLADCDARGQ